MPQSDTDVVTQQYYRHIERRQRTNGTQENTTAMHYILWPIQTAIAAYRVTVQFESKFVLRFAGCADLKLEVCLGPDSRTFRVDVTAP